MNESYIEIKVLVKKRGWCVAYMGPDDNVPERFKEDIALIDAADDGGVVGLGLRNFSIYKQTTYYLSSHFTRSENGQMQIPIGVFREEGERW